ncbi:MAG: Ig domain-containing protein [Pseudomonadota bacterium]|nr:Ig domain-containing protein [Pseudomonadota bacterium]
MPSARAIRTGHPDSATRLPAGLSINAGTGVITGTVSTTGASTVTVTVSDGKGGTTPTSFTWTVTSPTNRR